jgi:hypothetical protein
MTVTSTPHVPTRRRNAALVAARTFAGLLASMQLAGVSFFLIIAPEEAVYVGPWVDVPVIIALLTGVLLKLALAVGPGLDPGRRITVGLAAVAIGVAVTLVKVPVYDEPESMTFIVLDGVLLGLLLLARRGAAR